MVKAKLGKALAKKLSDFIDEMKDKYAMTPDQTKSAIRNYYNEGYEAGSPKRMLPGDDEPLALTVTNNTILPSTKADFMQDIFEQSVMDDVLGEARKELDLLKLRQLDPTKMTKQADGGRVGMIKGGLLKGLASLFKKKKPEKTEKFGPPRDPERDYETAAALKESRKRYDLERKNLSPLQDELDKMLIAEKKRGEDILNELKIATSEMEEKTRALEEFNRIAEEDGIEAALEAFEDIINPKRTLNADGGRIELGIGGAASGIMQAIKLAARGVKPFGQKQTYKQKVTTKGVSQEQFDEIFEKQLNRVPDEVYDEPTGKGLHTSLLEAEAILTGQKLGLMTQTQRTKIAKAMRDKVAKQIYDNPVAGLSNDYLEYMDDAVGRMDDIFEIERLGGDLTPKPIFDGKEMIGAQVDFTQLNRLGDKVKDNVIPFKPRDKKSKGGLMSLLKTLGMRAPDKIADKKQIENVIRDPKTDLERILKDNPSTGTKATPKDQPTIDEIRDMIQNDPRYDKLTAAQMDEVVKRETVRADFAYNMGIKPEEVDDQIVDMLMMEGYASRFGFKDGGAAYINKATLESIRDMPIRSRGSRMPYVQKMQSDMEKYMRMGKKEGGVISEAELADPRYNSATGEYEIGGGVKLGKLELDMLARGVEGYDPTMKYEGKLDLGNDFMLQGGYYDDAIMQPGMMSPEDEIRLSLTKSFANGGTVPPQKGPMSQGMGTLYRSK